MDYLVQSVSDVKEISIKTSLGSVDGVRVQMIQAVPVWQSDDSSPFEMGVLVPDNTDDTYLELSALLAKFKAKIDSLWEKYKTSDNKRNTLVEINTLNDELEQFKNSVLAMRKIRSRNGSVIFEKSIDYGYAHTIHKSQGGTYNEVMILGDTINTFKDQESKQQLRYVAMSRAKHKVTVVTNHELGDPMVTDNYSNDSEPINIHYGNNENKDLSNFAERPFTIENFIFNADGTEILGNVEFRSVEAAFHYTKLNYSNMDRIQKAKVANLILNAKTGAEAKNYGGRFWIKDFDKQLWDKEKFDIMKELIKESFKQNPDALQKLLATGNATLTHNPADAEWSTAFPKILMEVRDELRSTDKSNINNTENTDNDPVNFASNEESVNTINSAKTILTNEEARKLRPFVGDMPRIAVASEHTDPVLFSKKIIKILNGEESVEDKFKNTSYSGKDFAGLYLITKHDGLPLKELLEHPIPKIIHFSITGLGGTKWEPGVMKYNDLLDRIEQFIEQGLDPEMVTVRIDPIIPGVSNTSDIEAIIKRASEMGIKNIRYSVMDRYKTTSKYMEALGYDYSKYYPSGGLHANQNIRDAIDKFMVSMIDKYGIKLATCAEPNSKYADKISKEACLSVAAVNNMLGTNIPETATGKQRQLCSCFGGKTDLLRYDNKCASCCGYCYAHHNLYKILKYYNEDGTLKDIPLTRTSKDGEVKQQSNDLVITGSASTFTDDQMSDINSNKYKNNCK